MKFSLDKFKKISQKGHITTLKHPEGHEIKINHSILSPKMRGELAALPQHEEEQPFKDGGEAKHAAPDSKMNLGDFPQDSGPYPGEEASAENAVEQSPEANIQDQESEELPAQPENSQPATQQASPPAAAPTQSSAESLLASHKNLTDSHNALVQMALAGQSKSAPSPAGANPPAPASINADTSANPNNLMGSNAAAVKEEGQAIANQGLQNSADQARQANVLGAQNQSLAQGANKIEEFGNQYHKAYQDLADDIAKNPIDSGRWQKTWAKQDTTSKIVNGIGMLLGAAGVGVSGHPELASKFIQNAMDRDIDEQKANLGRKQNLLSKYTEMYHSQILGENALRLQQSAIAEGMIKQSALKAGTANAMNQANQAIAQLRQKNLGNLQNLAKGQYEMGLYRDLGSSGGPNAPASGSEEQFQKHLGQMRMLNPDVGRDLESRYVPGIGIAGKPLPNDVQQKLIASKNLSDRLADLENFANDHQGTVLDRATVLKGKTLAKNVQGAYRQATNGGVFKESEAKFIDKLVPDDPTAFFAQLRTIPQYKETRDINNAELNSTLKGYGVKPFNQGAQVVQRGYNPQTNQTQVIYSDGRKAILPGKQ